MNPRRVLIVGLALAAPLLWYAVAQDRRQREATSPLSGNGAQTLEKSAKARSGGRELFESPDFEFTQRTA